MATLLVVVTAICVFLAARVNRQHSRREAIAKIESLGGGVETLREYYDSPKIVVANFGQPEIGLWGWLLGDNPETYLIRVYFDDNSNVTDAALANLLQFGELPSLAIRNAPNVTDKGIAELRKALPNCRISLKP